MPLIRALPGVRSLWIRWLALRNEVGKRQPTQVEPGIWIGGLPTPRRWTVLQKVGVSHVVLLLGEVPVPAWLRDCAALLFLPVRDRTAPTKVQLEDGCRFIDDALRRGLGVAICCGSGAGRAPTLYVAWRARRTKESSDDVIRFLQGVRPVVDPTPEQRRALTAWKVGA